LNIFNHLITIRTLILPLLVLLIVSIFILYRNINTKKKTSDIMLLLMRTSKSIIAIVSLSFVILWTYQLDFINDTHSILYIIITLTLNLIPIIILISFVTLIMMTVKYLTDKNRSIICIHKKVTIIITYVSLIVYIIYFIIYFSKPLE
jgi:hypothetical protein